jgi:hypothetical protein
MGNCRTVYTHWVSAQQEYLHAAIKHDVYTDKPGFVGLDGVYYGPYDTVAIARAAALLHWTALQEKNED